MGNQAQNLNIRKYFNDNILSIYFIYNITDNILMMNKETDKPSCDLVRSAVRCSVAVQTTAAHGLIRC